MAGTLSLLIWYMIPLVHSKSASRSLSWILLLLFCFIFTHVKWDLVVKTSLWNQNYIDLLSFFYFNWLLCTIKMSFKINCVFDYWFYCTLYSTNTFELCSLRQWWIAVLSSRDSVQNNRFAELSTSVKQGIYS